MYCGLYNSTWLSISMMVTKQWLNFSFFWVNLSFKFLQISFCCPFNIKGVYPAKHGGRLYCEAVTGKINVSVGKVVTNGNRSSKMHLQNRTWSFSAFSDSGSFLNIAGSNGTRRCGQGELVDEELQMTGHLQLISKATNSSCCVQHEIHSLN